MKIDKSRIILIVLAAVLAIALAVLVILALGDLSDRNTSQPQETTQTPTTEVPVGDDEIVQTPYGRLVFPGQWVSNLQVEREEEPDLIIRFLAKISGNKTHPLFDVRFGEALDPAVGQVVSAEGVAVGVHVTVHPFNPDGSWAVKDAELVSNMLECMNEVLDGLNMVPLGSPIPEIDGDEMALDTPYCKLYFPSRWLEELRLTVDESKGYYEVVFKAAIGEHEPIPIFAVNFGGEGQSVGRVLTDNDVPIVIYARSFDINTEGWGSVDVSTLLAMRDDINHLLSRLPQ